jgi:hypothetical protein
MNGDAFKRVRQGDSMQIPAAAWNACLDAAEAHKRGEQSPFVGVPQEFRQADIVLVKNSSGSDVSRFGILGISGVIITPAANLSQFQNKNAFTGVTPTVASHSGKFVICLDAIKNGQIGRAWVSGVSAVQIDITDTSHKFCDVKDSDRTKLSSSNSGSARIVYSPGGTGTKWCGVRLGDGAGGDPVRLGKTSSTWTKNTTATIDLWEGGTPPSETSSSATLANCVNKMVTVPSGRWVEVAQGVNGYWYLVWAEPEQLTVLTGVSLTGSGLVFTRKTISTYVDSTTPADVTITTTSCP